MKNSYAAALVFLLSISISSAQTDSASASSGCAFQKAYLKSYAYDTKAIFTAPLKWSGKQWIVASLAIGATIGLSTQDVAIHDLFQNNRNAQTNNIAKYVGEPFGRGIYTMGIMGGLYMYGTLCKNEKAKNIAFIGLKTYIISGVANYVFKELFQRHRPYQVEDELKNGKIASLNQYELDGPIPQPNTSLKDIVFTPYTSFPSGHTVSAFAMATVLATAYKEHKWVPIAAYSLATLTGLSRINDNKHWASDVFMGAVLGYGMAKLIYTKNTWGITTAPYASSKALGMVLVIPLQ